MGEAELRTRLEEQHAAAFTWALHCCGGDEEEAKDVLQSVYLKVLEGKAPFAGRSSFKTWLFTLIRRTACTANRRLVRQIRRMSGQSAGPEAAPATTEERIYQSELREVFTGLLSRLSRCQREVLYLVFYHELTIEEAAPVMGVSVGSARTHYHRGKERLREQIEKAGIGHELAEGRTENQAAV